MKLGKLLKILKDIKKIHGEDINIVMADDIAIVDPVVMDKYPDKKKIVITDEK